MALTFADLKKLKFTSPQVSQLLGVPHYIWPNRQLREDLPFVPEPGFGVQKEWSWEQIEQAQKYLRAKPPRKRKK